MKEITKEDKINWAIHNVELEGYKVDDFTKQLLHKFTYNKLTSEECIEILNKRFKK